MFSACRCNLAGFNIVTQQTTHLAPALLILSEKLLPSLRSFVLLSSHWSVLYFITSNCSSSLLDLSEAYDDTSCAKPSSSDIVQPFVQHFVQPCWIVPRLTRSSLVNIRRKAISSSVGFRKRMTSRSPQSLICDPSALRFSASDLFDFWWEVLPHFFDHSSIDTNQFKHEDATASV